MNRGWFVERFTERISGHRLSNASGNSSSTTNNTEERPTLVMRSQSARTAREEAMSLEKYVESVLKDAEKCVLAIQVAKIQKATRKMKRSLFSPNQGGDSRILAICRSSREHLHFNLYKLYPAPSGKMSRQWLISDLGEVDGKGVNVGEFSLTFGDKIYAFRARSVSERNKFLWELMQSCKKSKGKAPVVRGIRLLELQEDAEKAAKEADKHAQEKAQQEVELNAPGSRRLLFNGTSIPGESTSMRTESELEPLSSKPPQHPASSQAKQSSQNLRNSDPNITHNVDDKSDNIVPKTHESETTTDRSGDLLENGDKSEDNIGAMRQMEKVEAQPTEEVQRKEELLNREMASLCLRDDEVEDLLVTMATIDLGGSSNGMRFRDQLRAEIRELETSNMLNLIRSEKEEHKVMNSLEKLQNDLKGADTWLGDCDARLSSCTVVISDIEGEMRSLEVQMASAKALYTTTSQVLGSVTLSKEQEDVIDLVTMEADGDKLDDNDFVPHAKVLLEPLVEKLRYKPDLPELHKLRVLSTEREKVLKRGGDVIICIDRNLKKRMEVILSNTAVEINERSKEEGKSVYTFSLLCGLLMSLDPKSGSDIVSLYGQRKGKIIENQLLTLQPIVEAETSTKKTLTKAVDTLAPVIRKEKEILHSFFDLTADAASKERNAFMSKILQGIFQRVPQFLDDCAAVRAQKSGMLVFLQLSTWVARRKRQRQVVKMAAPNGDGVEGNDRRLDDPALLVDMLDSFSDRCRDRLRQHVNEVIENSARTATQAAAAAAAFGPESTSRASGKANGALSSFSVFYVDNYDMVMLSVELMSVGKMEHDEECLKEAQTLSERLLDSAFKNVEIVACDDSTRSLVIRAENYYCIAGGLGTINVQSMADMEKVARNTQERATTRCIDRVLKRCLARMTDIQVTGVTDARYWSAAARLEVSKKVAMALAETKDEHKLARSMVQPFEDNVSHAARKTIFPYFLRQLSNAASDRINRLSKFMADNGFEAEEQGLQNLRRRLEGALMQLRMKK